MKRFLSVYIPVLIEHSIEGIGMLGFAAIFSCITWYGALSWVPIWLDIEVQVAELATEGFVDRLDFFLAMLFVGMIALPLLAALCISTIMLVGPCVGIIVMPVLVARETMNTFRNPQGGTP